MEGRMLMKDKKSLQQELEELREEYSKTKDNKATNKHLSMIRAKIASINKQMTERKSAKGAGFSVKKSGDGVVALVGFPNAGKSSLLGILTNVESKVAGYAFTTLEVIPGMLLHKGANIQVLDLPGLIEEASSGKGGGAKIASVIRVTDLILFVVDIKNYTDLFKLLDELDMLGIRLNRRAPRARIERSWTGGINIEKNGHSAPDPRSVMKIFNEFGIYNANLILHQDLDSDQLVDLLSENIVYIKGIVALNKIDTLSSSECEHIRKEIVEKTEMEVVLVSAVEKKNIEELKDAIFNNLELIRIFLKPKEGEVDLAKPLVVKKGSSVFTVAKTLHSKIANNLRYAYVTGKSVKFGNQKVGSTHVVEDGDIVTLIYSKT
jgi:hypothetical protein